MPSHGVLPWADISHMTESAAANVAVRIISVTLLLFIESRFANPFITTIHPSCQACVSTIVSSAVISTQPGLQPGGKAHTSVWPGVHGGAHITILPAVLVRIAHSAAFRITFS